jgi:hypothetical protein
MYVLQSISLRPSDLNLSISWPNLSVVTNMVYSNAFRISAADSTHESSTLLFRFFIAEPLLMT